MRFRSVRPGSQGSRGRFDAWHRRRLPAAAWLTAAMALSPLALAPLVPGAAARAQGTPEGTAAAPAVRVDRIAGAGGVELAIHEAGRPGAPAIIFIHGFSQNSLTWERQLRSSLADEFHLIAYDMRGHGGSDKPLDAAQYTDGARWADELAAVIRARNLQRPVVVGWSYGGYVITDYVRRHGDDALGGIVIVSSTTKNGTEDALQYFGDDILAIFGDLLSADVRQSLEGTRALMSLFTEPGSADWNTAYGSGMMVAPAIRAAMFDRVLDNDDVLARIRVPTLVVHGVADRIVKFSAGEHTASKVPGARLLGYDSAGHAPHIDAAERFNRDLAEFTRSVARR
jgi:non-heme chloroperoxidase